MPGRTILLWVEDKAREFGGSVLAGLWLSLKALPLLLLWLLLPAGVYLLFLDYQAEIPARELPDSTIVQVTQQVRSTVDGDLTLVLAHPRKLLLDSQDKPVQPVAIWLLRAIPTSMVSPSSTFTTTPSLYLVTLAMSGDYLTFADKNGIPALPRITLSPAITEVAPSVLYMRPAATAVGQLSAQVEMTALLRSADGVVLNAADPLKMTIGLESVEQSYWRRWWALAGQITSILAALAAALLGFAVQQWKQRADEEQKERQARDVALAEVNSLAVLLEHADWPEARRKYQECCDRTRTEACWRDPQVRTRLRDVWQEKALRQLQNWHELSAAYKSPDKGTWMGIIDRLGIETTSGALLWGYTNLRQEDQDTALRMLTDLCQPKYIGGIENHIAKNLEGRRLLGASAVREKLEQLRKDKQLPPETRDTSQRLLIMVLEPSPWLSPWKAARLPDEAGVRTALQLLGLRHNPFGPELAELDPLLPDYRAGPPEPASLAQARGPRPALIFGAPGSGKTATALLLGYDCYHFETTEEERGAFPVYHVPRLDAVPAFLHHAQLHAIAGTMSQALLQALAAHPYAFLDHEPANKAAMVHLLAIYVGTSGDLALQLQRAGLASGGVGARVLGEVEKIVNQAKLEDWPDEMVLIDLLGKARPHGFSCTYLLVDIAKEPADGEVAAIAAQLQPLLDLAVPLARVGVYSKAFLPEKLQSHLRINPPFQPMSLTWREPDLKALLVSRLHSVGCSSLDLWCDSEAKAWSLDERLIQAAKESPRELIRYGNRLLACVAAHPDRPLLTAADIVRALKST